MAYFRPHHRKGGITEQQWRVIRVLYLDGETDATSLARRSYLLAPSLSRILKDLEAAGYVRRRPGEDDSRQSLLSLSPKGSATVTRRGALSRRHPSRDRPPVRSRPGRRAAGAAGRARECPGRSAGARKTAGGNSNHDQARPRVWHRVPPARDRRRRRTARRNTTLASATARSSSARPRPTAARSRPTARSAARRSPTSP